LAHDGTLSFLGTPPMPLGTVLAIWFSSFGNKETKKGTQQ
jgi:hypothetical protein